MHLPLARLVSQPVIFCLPPSSSIVILVFYLFSTVISEQHVWELWVWIQSTGLTLPLRVTPMNNHITVYHQYSRWAKFLLRWQLYAYLCKFPMSFSESQNASPLDAELEPWMWRVGRYSERKKRKSPFTTTPLSFDADSLAKTREYLHKSYLARN